MVSFSNIIPDRTSFLLGKTKINPSEYFVNILMKLEMLGATVAGIPCNTSHSPLIFNSIKEKMKGKYCTIKLLNMIEETKKFVCLYYSGIKKIGLLATIGTYKTEIYQKSFMGSEIEIIIPNKNEQNYLVHEAIYNQQFGIKANGMTINKISKDKLYSSINILKSRGAEAIILGCTEIALVIKKKKISNIQMIDPTLILARALIKEIDENCIKPIN